MAERALLPSFFLQSDSEPLVWSETPASAGSGICRAVQLGGTSIEPASVALLVINKAICDGDPFLLVEDKERPSTMIEFKGSKLEAHFWTIIGAGDCAGIEWVWAPIRFQSRCLKIESPVFGLGLCSSQPGFAVLQLTVNLKPPWSAPHRPMGAIHHRSTLSNSPEMAVESGLLSRYANPTSLPSMDLAHVPSANRLVDINNDALVAQDILDLLYPTLFSSGPSHVSVLIHFIADCFAIWEPTLTVPSIRISRSAILAPLIPPRSHPVTLMTPSCSSLQTSRHPDGASLQIVGMRREGGGPSSEQPPAKGFYPVEASKEDSASNLAKMPPLADNGMSLGRPEERCHFPDANKEKSKGTNPRSRLYVTKGGELITVVHIRFHLVVSFPSHNPPILNDAFCQILRAMEVSRGHKLQLTAGAAMILERVTLPATLRPPPGPGHSGWRCRLLLWRKDQDAFAGESEYVVLATLIPTKDENYKCEYFLFPGYVYTFELLGGGESVHISGRFPADMKVPNSRYPDTTFRPLAGKIPVPAPITEIKEEEEEGTMPGGLGQVSGAMRIQGYNKPA
ncbi:hypothetical protein DFP72DRAFT_1064550 [Ephemerocybe angulata]|uniref:Uncharacterized protein n=1 Tax=Ephemerocybe angulata TaxID=980116 RepID=A0A8H6I703_9AGAR|nr:hypothetical protein DFP72DRAFT_1064511 [Tulosesus angulatus]KAF6759052.1 hypothetical protein DFP72DRAFT_1064550 [Tulosesus angulatus]